MAAKKSRLAELLKGLPDQPSPRLTASKRNGRQGGLVRAARHGELELTAWGEKAGNALLRRYGHSYYAHIAKTWAASPAGKEYYKNRRKVNRDEVRGQPS